jgi:hypothetical protein
MEKFCHHCGKKYVVGAKFCPECGTNLLSLSSTPTPTTAPKQTAQFSPFTVQSDDEDGDSYIDRLAHANIRQTELHVEVIKSRPLGETIGQAMAAGATINPSNVETIKRVAPQIDEQTFLKEFRKEAGTIRND